MLPIFYIISSQSSVISIIVICIEFQNVKSIKTFWKAEKRFQETFIGTKLSNVLSRC